MRKNHDAQEEEVIDDPDSPEVNKFANSRQITNKRSSKSQIGRPSIEEPRQSEEVSSQFVYHLFGKNSHQLIKTK